MHRTYNDYVPKDLPELVDLLGMMMISSPSFVSRYHKGNIHTVFAALDASLEIVEGELGPETHARFVDMSKQMRTHFEADPEDKTDETLKGRDLIYEMIDILDKQIRATRNLPPRRAK